MAIGCGCQHPVFSINIFGVTGVIAIFFKTGFRDIYHSPLSIYLKTIQPLCQTVVIFFSGSPVAFPKKYDVEGKFVKHYLPVLRKYPAKYIYEPWKAPLNVQREAGCIIG
jgi:hypothetical protein